MAEGAFLVPHPSSLKGRRFRLCSPVVTLCLFCSTVAVTSGGDSTYLPWRLMGFMADLSYTPLFLGMNDETR